MKSAIKGYKVKGWTLIPRSGDDRLVLEAVLEPKIGVLAAAVGVLDTFFAYKVCLNIKKQGAYYQ